MIDRTQILLLQEIAHRESRSFLQYIEDSFPWTEAAEQPTLTLLRQLIREEQGGTVGLLRLLHRRHLAPPYLGSYPEPFTALNYMALDYLLPLLVEHQRKGVADLERDLGRLTDAEAVAEVRKILETKRRHLHALKTLPLKQPRPVGSKE